MPRVALPVTLTPVQPQADPATYMPAFARAIAVIVQIGRQLDEAKHGNTLPNTQKQNCLTTGKS